MQARLRLASRLLFLSSCRMTVLTGSVAAVLVAVQIGPLGGQSWAQAVFPVDAEENGRSLQDHVLDPVWNRRLQVLLVHQANYQHRLRQADHQQGHAHHEVHAWDTGETTPGSPKEAVRAVKGFRQEPDSPISGVPMAVAGSVSETMMRKTEYPSSRVILKETLSPLSGGK